MKRVLIVNDKATTRRIINLALGQVPNLIVIGEANNGWDAVDFVEAEQPDVIVMDFRMPLMDGLEATERITKSWPHVKVVMHSMTGVSRQAGKAVGACAVLRPYDSMKMLQTAVMDA